MLKGQTNSKYGLPDMFDNRDTVHNAAYFGIACLTSDREHKEFTEPVLKKLWRVLWPYKNPSYFWHNSDGLTKKLADWLPFLRNIKKGLNGDQCFPMLMFLALSRNYKYTNKFLLGMFLRSLVICVPTLFITEIGVGLWLIPLASLCCWYPNGELLILKPHHLAPVARLYRLYPIYWFLDVFAYISFKISIKISISVETTNKIKIFPYLWLAEKQPTFWTRLIKREIRKTTDYYNYGTLYFDACYLEYFKNNLTTNILNCSVVKLGNA